MNPFSPTAPLLSAMMILLAIALAQATEPLLERDVLPVLQKNCMGCHGGLKQKGGLDLRTLGSMLKGGESGPVLVAGDPEASELWLQIAEDDMPKGNDKLSADDKRMIHSWIAAGLPVFGSQSDKGEDALLSLGEKHEPLQVAEAIDEYIHRGLTAVDLSPVPIVDDSEFLRRIYLDVTGRVPTPKQATAFLGDGDPDKRTKLIDALLATPEFGEHFGRTWRDWICPPELPSDMNGGKQPHNEARQLGVWLGSRFAAGDPWDQIVRDLLTVEGEIKEKPHLIFFGLAGQNAKITPDGSARSVASLFMGVQLGCAQCHDDPYRDWAQNEFWSLAAFFGNVQGDFNKVTESPGHGRVTIPKSAFKNAGTEVPVAFLGGDGELPSDEKNKWRSRFVDWLAAKDNPFFGRAFANRLWFHFFARGIVNPVDDFRELNPPSHPGLMSLIADEFSASGFDVKHVVRCVCNSKAYQRMSASAEISRETAIALTENFGRMPLRVMTADMLYDSLKLAYGDPNLDLRAIDPKDGNQNGESAPVGDPYLQFQRDFCTNEEDATDFIHGIPQMLTLINHPRLLAGSKALVKFLETKPTPEQTIEWLYLATLSRRPSNEETGEALKFVGDSGDQEESYDEVLWMLVNRSEFIFLR
jgi:hypothetical protein